jgi:tRNA-Thr(GGU) m(6)t(6)A37 methyltransferase TsaA
MFPGYREAMYGLSSFSHTIILYWLHLNDSEEQRTILKVTPRRHKGAPEIGVFACRSPVRPNPIDLSVCEVVTIEEDTLNVRDLDAIEGSPIIDIKP